MLSFTEIDENRNVDNLESGEEEMNLDLPVVTKKVLSGNRNRILSDSDMEEDSNNSEKSSSEMMSNSFNSNSISYATSENESNASQSRNSKSGTKSSSKQKQYLSTEWIVDSDTDDGGADADHDPSKPPPPPSSSPIRTKKSRNPKSPKIDFKRASEDFKSTLKLGWDIEEDEDASECDSERKHSETDGNEADSDDINTKVKVKKPKEKLKNVLKESESLLRRINPVELNLEVPRPKSFDLILSEALAVNSRSPIEARKRVIEEKRKAQQARMEKLLGAERMARLSLDNPKIGQFKLDEAVEIDVQVLDEKATEGSEDVLIEKVKVKLVDLPDKHFHTHQRNTPLKNSTTATYKVYLQSQKKASIELLNRQLQEKIAAQGNAFIAHHQREREAQAAAKRSQAAKKEQIRRSKEAKKELELSERREKKAEGGDLFTSEKYSAIERRPVDLGDSNDETVEEEEDSLAVNRIIHDEPVIKFKKSTVKIVCSDDSGDEDTDLLDLDSNVSDDERDSLSGLLSGKFDSDNSEGEDDLLELPDVDSAMEIVKNRQIKEAAATTKFIKENTRKPSEFIDDEASDEDEEREVEDIDEMELQEEMLQSKFIASSDEEENADELIEYLNEKNKKEDEEITKRMVARYGRHFDEYDGETEMLNALGNKYGISNKLGIIHGRHGREQFSKDDDDDDELKKLLFEQKKRKIDAIGGPRNPKRYDLNLDDDEGIVNFPNHNSSHHASSDNEFYAADSSDSFDDSDNNYYEREESGLQSKLNEEADLEEEQVQAAVDLDRKLSTMNYLPVKKKTPAWVSTPALSVPKGDAKLKSKLMALLGCENDEGSGGNNSDRSKVFKGFITSASTSSTSNKK